MYQPSLLIGLSGIDEVDFHDWFDSADDADDADDWLVADIVVADTVVAVVVASDADEGETGSCETSSEVMNAKVHFGALKPLWRGYREAKAQCSGQRWDRRRLGAIF